MRAEGSARLHGRFRLLAGTQAELEVKPEGLKEVGGFDESTNGKMRLQELRPVPGDERL